MLNVFITQNNNPQYIQNQNEKTDCPFPNSCVKHNITGPEKLA